MAVGQLPQLTRATSRSVERVPFMSQVIAKWLHRTLRKNLETPACNVGPRSNICGNQVRAIPNHTSKPLPSWPSQAPRRPHSSPCYSRDRGTSRWCWPRSASQQRLHMPAHKCLHANYHTLLHPDGRSFDGKQMQRRMRALCVLLRILFVCTKTCLKLRPTLPHIMCVEGHPLADMSRYKHVILNFCTTVQHA